MDYYKQKLFIAKVDEKGNLGEKIERWNAVESGILHLAFTVAIEYQGKYILQHRKHPVFDGVFDLTSSSHQIFEGEDLQTSEEAVYKTLDREWGLTKDDLVKQPKKLGQIFFNAKDPNSKYAEHELCEFWSTEVVNLPTSNFDYAYGFSVVTKEELKHPQIRKNLAPWVTEGMKVILSGLH